MADVDLKFSSPEMRVNINRDKAGTMGATVRDIAETLQYGLSGQRMGYFYMNGKQYEILGQINRQQRNTPANIKSIYIRSDKGEMIQLDNLVEFVESVAPPKLYHYNRLFPLPYLPDWQMERPSDKAWKKWIKSPPRLWTKPSVPPCRETPKTIGKVHPA